VGLFEKPFLAEILNLNFSIENSGYREEEMVLKNFS